MKASGGNAGGMAAVPGSGVLGNNVLKTPRLATPNPIKEAANPMGSSKKAHKRGLPNHIQQLPRLRRVEGQVRGVQQMIENERDCLEIAHQISAVIAAMRRVQGDMLRDHLSALAESSISGDLSAVKARKLASEVGAILTRLI